MRKPAEHFVDGSCCQGPGVQHLQHVKDGPQRPSAGFSDPAFIFLSVHSNTESRRTLHTFIAQSGQIAKLVKVAGIVVSSSSITARPVAVHAVCRFCASSLLISCNSSFGAVSLPRNCSG